MTQWQRVYIDVDCIIQSDGVMRPRIIKWPDGRHFIIDKVICRRQAADDDFVGGEVIGGTGQVCFRPDDGALLH